MSFRPTAALLLFLAALPVTAQEPDLRGRSIVEWIKDLDDKQSLVREEAIEVLIRAKAKEAVPKLTKLLDDPMPSVRRRAAIALWKIDGQTKPARVALLAAVRDLEASQRRESLLMLRDTAPPDDEFISLLISLLEDRDGSLAMQARNLLQFYADKAVPAIVAALPKADAEARLRLINHLGRLGPAHRDKVESALRDLLPKADDRTKMAIIRALRTNGEVEGITPALAEIAAGKDAIARREATQMALSMRPPRRELAPVYRLALKDDDALLRGRGVEALYELDPASLKETMPVLVALMKDGNMLRSGALRVLQRLGPDAKVALPAIAELLANSNDTTANDYAALVHYLGRMGPDAVPHLARLLKHPNAMIRQNAAGALWQVGAPALPHLVPLLKDENPEVRRAAFRAISHLGNGAEKALPQLIEGLKDADPQIRQHALTTVLALGPAGKEAVAPLMDLLNDESLGEHQRARVAETLGHIGADAKAAAPALRKLLKSDQAQLRLRSAEALWLITGDRTEALAVLLDGLKNSREALHLSPNSLLEFAVSAGVPPTDIVEALKGRLAKDPGLKRVVVILIGQHLPAVKEAVPLLTELVKDQDEMVRRQAALALARHGAAGKEAAPVLAEIIRRESYPDNLTLAALTELGPAGAEALPALLDAWKRPQSAALKPRLAEVIVAIDREKGKEQLAYLRTQLKARSSVMVTLTVAAALARVEPKNPDLLGVVRAYAKMPSPVTTGRALEVLGTMRADAAEALPVIRAQLKNDDASVRLRAAEAFWRVSGKPSDSVLVLAALLHERAEPGIRGGMPVTRSALAIQAAQILGEIGPSAAAALPDLRKCQTDPDASLRRAAAAAIKRIEK